MMEEKVVVERIDERRCRDRCRERRKENVDESSISRRIYDGDGQHPVSLTGVIFCYTGRNKTPSDQTQASTIFIMSV